MIQKIVLACIMVVTSSVISCAETIPFDSDMWQFKGDGIKVVQYKGKESLYIPDGGKAYINNADFTNGIIEYAVNLPDARGFMGVMWRMQDTHNYEKFYMRPHQSGNPDANQYTPVYNSVSGWQLYYGEDFSVRYPYPFGEWLHVKIVISGKYGEIYIDDMSKPALSVTLKREVEAGMVGLVVDGSPMFKLAGAHFADFKYTAMESVQLVKQPEDKEMSAGIVRSWAVSSPFNHYTIENTLVLDDGLTGKLKWDRLASEDTGVTNFAVLRNKTKIDNTVFAKVTVVSEKDQVKQLRFGFSDRVKVYFNKQLMFSANDTYRTRDYRFLGTMGYYDNLYLPLKQGKNEIWFAVSEQFGGWGVQADFPDLDGIQIQ